MLLICLLTIKNKLNKYNVPTFYVLIINSGFATWNLIWICTLYLIENVYLNSQLK